MKVRVRYKYQGTVLIVLDCGAPERSWKPGTRRKARKKESSKTKRKTKQNKTKDRETYFFFFDSYFAVSVANDPH